MNTKIAFEGAFIDHLAGLSSQNFPSLCMDVNDIQDLVPKMQTGAEYSKTDVFYFITALIEMHLLEDAVKVVEQLIALDNKQWASILAEYLYDVYCPLTDDALWVKYMGIAGEGNYTSFEVITGSLIHENGCGVWIPGHKAPEFYTHHLFDELPGLEFDKEKVAPLVQHKYLSKKGSDFILETDFNPAFLPITTVTDEEFNDAISDLFYA